jgi:outer membrane receptor protein involved in Fe transport
MKRMLCCVLAILAGTAGAAAGQEGSAGGPMTYALARKANYVPLETLRETRSRIPAPLARQVTIARSGVLLQQVLLDIANQAELGLSYGEDLVRARVVVSLSAKAETAADALQQVTEGTDWAVLVTPTGQVAVLRREATQLGTIVGHVTDAKTGDVIVGATVVIDGTSYSTSTTGNGTYRFAEVAPGTYTVRARYIGYALKSASVIVTADQQTTADFALERSAQPLEEVVTTGTIIPTQVKALPTPVTVISDSLITAQRPHSLQELLRQAVPTGVSWDYPDTPWQTAISVRGASTLNGASGQMKVFVDGVETADAGFSALDPSSIARIEVIRGPQAASIYGSSAIGGVIQVFTKRGDPSLARPQVEAQATAGIMQTPYASYGGVFRQNYTAGVQGGGSDVSYNFGAGYSRTGNYLPTGDKSGQSSPSIYGGMHLTRGIVTADISGRYYVQNDPSVYNPDLASTGYPTYSRPLYQPVQTQSQTIGARLSVAPTTWWQHTLSVGLDRFAYDAAQTQARLRTPADTLLSVSGFSDTKASIGYNMSMQHAFSAGLSGTITAGFDHYSLPVTSTFVFGALNTTGSLQTGPGGSIFAYRFTTNNTGYFAQMQVAFRDALFLTGGLRAEQNSDFGDSLGTPISPRIGISFVQPMNGATLKLRGSWGRAIRAPSAGDKAGSVTSTSITLESPLLGPERQQGWDAGMDAIFGRRASLGVTYFDQLADRLIDFVQLQLVPVPTYQFENVGRVKNTGIEVEGTLSLGAVVLRGQYGYSRARVEQLATTYAGDLQVGDQTLTTPKHTAGASLSVIPFTRTTISAGLTYVGSWRNYDALAEFRCFGGTGPCQPTFRDYIVDYSGFVKLNTSIVQEVTPTVSGFISVDNLTNRQAFESSNLRPVVGRITTAGLRLRY